MKRHLFCAVLLVLAGCSEAPRPAEEAKKEPAKPPEPVTAQFAFHQMYLYARSWSPDIEVLRVQNIPIPQVKSEAAKFGAWETVFVSQGLKRQRRITYSVVKGEGNLYQGVFAGPEESWGGPGGQSRPFPALAFKIDAAAAYQTALKKSADYVKKHPGMPVNFVLEKVQRFPNPAWRVIWGESVSRSNYSIYVDATTGDYLTTMR